MPDQEISMQHNSEQVHVEQAEVIDASIGELWELVANFNNITSWHPDVASSQLEHGSGMEAGSIRALHLRDGTPVREQLLAISAAEHSYSYSVIESPLPLKNHSSTVQFEPVAANRTRVIWRADFEADGADPGELASGVKSSVIAAGIKGLRAAVKV
jgi:Polyketide cyclase / dehydrase and lipid transport